MIGALLRIPLEAVQWRMLDRLHEDGFDDLDAPHLNVFQYPGPQGARPSELAARLRVSKQALNYLLGGSNGQGTLSGKPIHATCAPSGSSRPTAVSWRSRPSERRSARSSATGSSSSGRCASPSSTGCCSSCLSPPRGDHRTPACPALRSQGGVATLKPPVSACEESVCAAVDHTCPATLLPMPANQQQGTIYRLFVRCPRQASNLRHQV